MVIILTNLGGGRAGFLVFLFSFFFFFILPMITEVFKIIFDDEYTSDTSNTNEMSLLKPFFKRNIEDNDKFLRLQKITENNFFVRTYESDGGKNNVVEYYTDFLLFHGNVSFLWKLEVFYDPSVTFKMDLITPSEFQKESESRYLREEIESHSNYRSSHLLVKYFDRNNKSKEWSVKFDVSTEGEIYQHYYDINTDTVLFAWKQFEGEFPVLVHHIESFNVKNGERKKWKENLNSEVTSLYFFQIENETCVYYSLREDRYELRKKCVVKNEYVVEKTILERVNAFFLNRISNIQIFPFSKEIILFKFYKRFSRLKRSRLIIESFNENDESKTNIFHISVKDSSICFNKMSESASRNGVVVFPVRDYFLLANILRETEKNESKFKFEMKRISETEMQYEYDLFLENFFDIAKLNEKYFQGKKGKGKSASVSGDNAFAFLMDKKSISVYETARFEDVVAKIRSKNSNFVDVFYDNEDLFVLTSKGVEGYHLKQKYKPREGKEEDEQSESDGDSFLWSIYSQYNRTLLWALLVLVVSLFFMNEANMRRRRDQQVNIQHQAEN